MNKEFSNSSRVRCIFNDEGIGFCGEDQEIFLPYGCIDSVKMSFMGVLQAAAHTRICTFAVDRKDRSEVKEMVKFALEAMKTAPDGEPKIIDFKNKDGEELVSSELPPEEQLRQYKMLFIQGTISKDQYDAKKRQLKK